MAIPNAKELQAQAQASIAEATGLSDAEVGGVVNALSSANKLVSARSASEVERAVKDIIREPVQWACHAGSATLLALAPASLGTSAIAAAALEAACVFGVTWKIEQIVLNNYRDFFSDTIPESVRQYYVAIYGVEPSGPLLTLMLERAKSRNALPSIFGIVRLPEFNPAVVKALQEAAAKKSAEERARLARIAEDKRKRLLAERQARSKKLAEFFEDLPAQKLEPLRRYLMRGGSFLRDDLATFDAVVKRRGLRVQKDGNITWPAFTAASVLVGGWIVWQAKKRA